MPAELTNPIEIGTFGIWSGLLDLHPTPRVLEIVGELDSMDADGSLADALL